MRLAERERELNPAGGTNALARILWRARETERSVAVLRNMLEANPRNVVANRFLSVYEAENGNLAQAEAHLNVLEELELRSRNLTRVANMASRYAQLGLDEDATRVLGIFEEQAATRRVTAVARVWENMAGGSEDQVLEALETVAEAKQPYQGFQMTFALKFNTFNIPLLDEPEFVAVRERLGFTDL